MVCVKSCLAAALIPVSNFTDEPQWALTRPVHACLKTYYRKWPVKVPPCFFHSHLGIAERMPSCGYIKEGKLIAQGSRKNYGSWWVTLMKFRRYFPGTDGGHETAELIKSLEGENEA